jgi:hypothetical protein
MSKINPWTPQRVVGAFIILLMVGGFVFASFQLASEYFYPDSASAAKKTWEEELDLASDRAARKADEEILGAQPEYYLRVDSLWKLIGKDKDISRTQWEFVGLVVKTDSCIHRISIKHSAIIETWQ